MKNRRNNQRFYGRCRSLALATLCGLMPLATTTTAQAQITMSLAECVEFALEHNNSIQQRRLAVQSQEVQLNTTRMSRLPDLGANVGQRWSFGRTTLLSDNSYSSGKSASTTFDISASVPLFTGFRIENQIKSDSYALQAASANLEKARKDIGIQVATYYLNALYYRGLADVQRQQVSLDSMALANALSLVDAGRKPQSEVAAADAQLALSQHSLTEAVGNETLARLDLMQLLNMEGSVEDFAIRDIDTTQLSADVTPAATVFAAAVERYPSILAARYQLEGSRHDLKVMRSGYLPSLSLSAGYSTNYQYMYNFKLADGTKVPQKSFGDQFSDHSYKSIGLNLNIPIFDRFQTRNNLRRARLNIENQATALNEAQLSLQKEIQQAYWNAIKARDNYASSQKAHASTALAYQYESERYAAGRGTSYELQQASSKLQRARQDELQAKYEFLMRLKILEFYSAE